MIAQKLSPGEGLIHVWTIPPKLAEDLDSMRLCDLVYMHARQIVKGTVPFAARSPHQTDGRPRILEDILDRLITDHVNACIKARSALPRHRATVKPERLTVVVQGVATRLASSNSKQILTDEAHRVATGLYGMAAAIVGYCTQAVDLGNAAIKSYNTDVLTASRQH